MSRKFLKQGAPMIALVLTAPFGLMYFNDIRFKYRKVSMLSRDEATKVKAIEDAKKAGIAVDPEAQAILEQAQAQAAQGFVNIRGPRPWEDSKEMQRQQREEIEKQKNKETS